MPKEKRIDVVRRLFAFWIDTMGKNPKRTVLSAKRKKKLEDRLQEGWEDPEGMIKEAILGCAASDFHQKRGRYRGRSGPRYDDLELICRDAEHVERFAERLSEARRARQRATDDDGQEYPWDNGPNGHTTH